MTNQFNYSFGSISFHHDYIIAIMNEGITVTESINSAIMDIIDSHFKGKNFIYIAHRINSYAVDPIVYKRVGRIKNLVGIAVVSSNKNALNNTDIEKLFITIPFEAFGNIEDAVQWSKKVIQ